MKRPKMVIGQEKEDTLCYIRNYKEFNGGKERERERDCQRQRGQRLRHVVVLKKIFWYLCRENQTQILGGYWGNCEGQEKKITV